MFDFNAVIPMPAALEGVEASSHAEMGASMIQYRADRAAPFADNGEYWAAWVREELNMRGAHVSDVAATYLARHPEVEQKGRDRLMAILETGFASWYPWAIAKWGTKWGAYRYAETGQTLGSWSFRFETAWSFPEPVFAELVKRFPALTFDLACYDEGSNFAGEGQLGAAVRVPFTIGDATDALYERVYGRPPEHDDGDD